MFPGPFSITLGLSDDGRLLLKNRYFPSGVTNGYSSLYLELTSGPIFTGLDQELSCPRKDMNRSDRPSPPLKDEKSNIAAIERYEWGVIRGRAI